MNHPIEDKIKIIIEPRYEGFGEKRTKVADFYFTLDGAEIATGTKIKNKFFYQLHMGEMERLDLNDDMQIIVHTISKITNDAFKTGWDFSYYEKDSWKTNADYFEVSESDKKAEFVQKLKQHKEEKLKKGDSTNV